MVWLVLIIGIVLVVVTVNRVERRFDCAVLNVEKACAAIQAEYEPKPRTFATP